MALTATKVDVWSTEIPDVPGGLAPKLASLASAGVNLDFLLARRQPDKPGTGVAYLAGVKGSAAMKAARASGFEKSTAMAAVRVEGPNQAGACHRLLSKIAEAGISLRGISASAIGKKFVAYVALDSDADAKQAIRRLNAK